ncbi:acetyltransferase (GNAT) family protein [Micromonospora pisi]|uniref:Acetyltransferase (GNAT) family protein n=1 Tax=Micromonospora pisi TaxID=589240 RepID=A0A495JMP2_9ACTN|nr:GNAT family N-acetyltransferase [Micromonospora pisi]RKR89925.1 acetyltransferase (GNAT) family protein [Micromonospora pisi]
MTENDSTAKAALAFQSGIEELAATIPGSYRERGANGTLLALTHAMVPALNPILSAAAKPDSAEIVALAEVAERESGQAPWSIRFRGEPDEEIARTATRYGLTTTSRQPFMIVSLEGYGPARPEPTTEVKVRRLSGDESDIFAAVLSAGFGAPPEMISAIYTPKVLDNPSISAYVAENDRGDAVSAGVAFLNDQYLGLANISTVPEFQRQGYGRALTEAILRDGHTAGAHAAYLHASELSLPFFESVGFSTKEYWTMLSAF